MLSLPHDNRRSARPALAGPYLTRPNSGMASDPLQPYGPIVESSVRVVTWNVWGRYGEWHEREAALEAALEDCQPEVVCLVESWSTDKATQAERIAGRLGWPHLLFVGDRKQEGWTSGIGVVSQWPIARHEERPLAGDDGDAAGMVLFAAIDGPRGPLQVFVAMLDYPLDASARRQAQVHQLCQFVAEAANRRHVTVVCGDFNAAPDSDEIRMLTGRAAVPVPGLVFYDAWEVAGDGSPGITWSNKNPLAVIGRYPDRRFDYIFSAWPRAGAAGHPTHCELLGVAAQDSTQISDHYGVLADLRY
jgi:endonuclease/exonuclease/phosphatase family metal-dependent hydrolase